MEKLGVRRILVDENCIFNLIMIARVEDKYYKSLQIHDFICILLVSVDMYALVCCRVWAKRVKSMIRKKKQYYNVMQAKRQKIIGDIANGFLERHTLFCFNLFSFVNFGTKCTDDTDFIANRGVVEEVVEDCDEDDDQKVCCEWSYEEETYSICNHVYEYQQMQMKEDIEHIDKDDDRLPKCNAEDNMTKTLLTKYV